jgi:hypothetical protein
MSFFEDLTPYIYRDSAETATKNVGWLGGQHAFKTTDVVDDGLLDLVWRYCGTSVAPTRGLHGCEFCAFADSFYAERSGEGRVLGSAEIRVFSDGDAVYAAPNLIYHYILAHRYAPPDEFIEVLKTGPQPPDPEYFERLSRLGLKWETTPSLDEKPKAFRFVKTPHGIQKVFGR